MYLLYNLSLFLLYQHHILLSNQISLLFLLFYLDFYTLSIENMYKPNKINILLILLILLLDHINLRTYNNLGLHNIGFPLLSDHRKPKRLSQSQRFELC